jgi:2-methylcitrate dehydratase PrpD
MAVAMPEDKTRSSSSAARFAGAADFILHLSFDDLPPGVVAHAQRCLLDLIGVAAAGSRTNAAQIACAHAAKQMRADDEARILFDGRRASAAGAAFAGATMIDSVDAHDGHRLTKGHAGVTVLPALLANVDAGAACSSREFVACIVLGYEIATRAGIALHATSPDFHSSGAWNALAAAAIGARLLGLGEPATRHALGAAEYFGPRSQIMRVCDSPSMVKDGSGWGAHAGVTAALLARAGFTGAPALTIESDAAKPYWSDLGMRWRILEQYFKAYPVCRWAQPAIEAALGLQRTAKFTAEDIAAITIESFREAVVLGAGCAIPATTDEAQYSLPFPVAAALVFGKVGAEEVEMPKLADPRVRRLLGLMSMQEDAEFVRRFPAERWARVRITLNDGRVLVSDPAAARGDPDHPLSDDEIRTKYRTLAEPVLGRPRTIRIERAVDGLASERSALPELLNELLRAPGVQP